MVNTFARCGLHKIMFYFELAHKRIRLEKASSNHSGRLVYFRPLENEVSLGKSSSGEQKRQKSDETNRNSGYGELLEILIAGDG